MKQVVVADLSHLASLKKQRCHPVLIVGNGKFGHPAVGQAFYYRNGAVSSG